MKCRKQRNQGMDSEFLIIYIGFCSDPIYVDFSGQRAELTNEFEDMKLCIACKAAISNLHTSRVEHQQANKIKGSFQNFRDIFSSSIIRCPI